MEDQTVALVIASNREDQFREFVDAWYGENGFPWDITILVQDGGGERFQPADKTPLRRWKDIVRYDWKSISASTGGKGGGDLPNWLARRDSGIKVWGFLDAVLKYGADIILTLDDDCLPCPLAADPSWYRKGASYAQLVEAARVGFVNQHGRALCHARKWTSTIPGFIPRGMPYGTDDDGWRQPLSPRNSLGELPVALNMGVWATIPDRDAVHELTNWTAEGHYKVWKPLKTIYRHSRVMSPQQYWPFCGMNVAFRREIAPLLYFPRTGEGVAFQRFDDIWCGVLLQKCLRHLGLSASVGGPIINHVKASRPMDNLVRESVGIRANEEFWRLIDNIMLWPGGTTPLRCMQCIGARLQDTKLEIKDEQLRDYMPRLGVWIMEWCDQFTKAGWE